jgi:GH43 family beta-xylosidase
MNLRLNLSGQRKTVNDANQIANLRTCYKNNKHDFIIFLVKNLKNRLKGDLSYTPNRQGAVKICDLP